jgi:hypothetical protein
MAQRARVPAPPCPSAKPRKQKSLQRPGEKESGVTRKNPTARARRPSLSARAFLPTRGRPMPGPAVRQPRLVHCNQVTAICPAARKIGTGRNDWRRLNSGRVKPRAKTSAPRQLVKIGSANSAYPSKKAENQAVSPASPVDDPTPAYDARDKGWRAFAGLPLSRFDRNQIHCGSLSRAGTKVVTSIAKS